MALVNSLVWRSQICCLSLALFCVGGGRLRAQPAQRDIVLEAMKERPDDPWPRGQGHVILGVPGSSEEDKAYHEPGGSFSPAFASFGVSLWVLDARGEIVATSDSIPLEQVLQQLVWPREKDLPGIQTETPYYSATWSAAGAGRWHLSLRIKTPLSLALLVRSVGPASGPLRSLDWDGKRLVVNKRWTLTFSAKVTNAQVGPEGIWGPGHAAAAQRWASDNGWAFARFPLVGSQLWRVWVQDATPSPASPLQWSEVRSALKLRVPERQFVDCLDAQVAHLLMGLVNRETRPGDPNHYPLNWLRDGAYVVVALARAGQVGVAKELCRPFAELDFFGGFGAEADGPGLALWALGEVAALAEEPAFDRWLWPHVERKARLIEEMLSATQPLRKPYVGPIVPDQRNRQDLDLVCEKAKDGLIVGRMDWHRPVLFINAVSYRGLLQAAGLAERAGRGAEAGQWRRGARDLRQAWNQAFALPAYENERNYICALYPTWVAADAGFFREKLEAFWRAARDSQGQLKRMPLWTYFSVATAHQWVLLGDPDRAWNDLRWFWAHQASPGLYTWWEGSGEENTFGRWASLARGWVKPPHVTPHYWTAAEMLLFQLDMLAYVDESNDEPVLMVGAGLPKEWLDQPLAAEGIGTRLGRVSWEWSEGRMKVTVRGRPCQVKLGGPFPEGTPLQVRF